MKCSQFVVIILAASLWSQMSFAVVEEGLKARPKPDYTKANELQGDLEEASLDNEIQAAEGASLKGLKNDALREEAILKNDLKRLETQEGQLKVEIEKAKKDADLAQDKVSKQKVVNLEARKRVLKSQKDRAVALDKLAVVNDKLRKSLEEEEATLSENRFLNLQVGMLEEDQEAVAEHTRRTEQNIAREKQRRVQLETNLARAKARKKELDAKAAKTEIRAEAIAPHPVRRPLAPQTPRVQQPAKPQAAAAPGAAPARDVSSQAPAPQNPAASK